MKNNSIFFHKLYNKLLKEFHPVLNKELKLSYFSYGSDKKVWWICDVAPDHEWNAPINNRANGSGCPCCAGDKVVLSNCLATTHPELAKQWDSTKNFPLTCLEVTAGLSKKVWWKCDKAKDHEWKTSIRNRSYGSGCPYCAPTNKKVILSNCLATTHPEIVKEWHPTKNNLFTPFNVTVGSGKKIWWKCPKAEDHEWQASISTKTQTNGKNGCPYCHGSKVAISNCLATTHKDLSKQWHPVKNKNLTPYDVTFGSHKKVWWKCPVSEDHEWESTINYRSSGLDCPYCANHKLALSNCLAVARPDLANQWHLTKNTFTPFDIVAGTTKRAWWQCPVAPDHEWEAPINSRINGTGCPCCDSVKVVLSNCLLTTHPEIAKQWHPTKNYITPFDIVAGSSKKVWWKCSVSSNHEWRATPQSRKESGCPFCYESKGEKRIKDILGKLHIHYEIQKFFPECKDKIRLLFDFYLPQYNILIEYDGIQHFEPIDYFGGLKSLKTSKKRDKIKNKFAKKNKIPLLRIPYTKFACIQDEIINFLGIKRQYELF